MSRELRIYGSPAKCTTSSAWKPDNNNYSDYNNYTNSNSNINNNNLWELT